MQCHGPFTKRFCWSYRYNAMSHLRKGGSITTCPCADIQDMTSNVRYQMYYRLMYVSEDAPLVALQKIVRFLCIAFGAASAHFSHPSMILRQTGFFGCRPETHWPIKAKGLANTSSDDP